ncbi:oligosaccharide flippase family protein [Candidatus Pacearchaeota archaeon]|nr:oligosaccharide flippase family protein [Candidatus Pacearchaeota archaeon]
MRINRDLLGGSIVLLITFNLYNFLNFIYQFSMARFLTVVEYGVLAALFSIIYVLAVFTESIQTVVAKYSSQESSLGRLKNLMNRSLRKSGIVALWLFIIYLIVSWPLSILLKIPYPLLALNGLVIFTSFLIPVTRGIMQGQRRFSALGGNLIIEAVTRLVVAIVSVLLLASFFPEMKVYGALIGVIAAVFTAFFCSFIPLREIKKSKEESLATPNIYSYTAPVFLITLVIIIFYSLDVIIAKIVFDAETAGFYAIASILAKTMFWGTLPVSKAMFPLSAQNKEKHTSSSNVLWNALGILALISLVGLLIVYSLPEFIIYLFKGEYIQQSAQILIYVTLAMAIHSFSNLILLYKLSKGKTRGYWAFLSFIILEVGILWYFSSDIIQFSKAFVLTAIIFLIGSLVLLRK